MLSCGQYRMSYSSAEQRGMRELSVRRRSGIPSSSRSARNEHQHRADRLQGNGFAADTKLDQGGGKRGKEGCVSVAKVLHIERDRVGCGRHLLALTWSYDRGR